MKAIADAALREDYSPEAVRIFRSMDAYETIFTLERLTDWLANGTKYRSDTQQFLDAFAEKARSGSPPPAHWVLYAAHLLLRAGIVVEEDKRSRNSRIAKELRLSGPRRLGRDTVVAAIVHKLVTEDGRRGNIEWAADRIANNWKALSESDLEGAPEWLTKHPLKDSYLKAKYREAKKVDVDLDLELLILNNGPDSLKKWVDLLVKPNM